MKKIIYSTEINFFSNNSCPKLYGNSENTNDLGNFDKFNDPDKYIIGTNNFINSDILNSFPEFLAGMNPIATTTGLIAFYESVTIDNTIKNIVRVAYNLLSENTITVDGELKNLDLNSINPDISPMLSYDHIRTPMNVRQLNFKDGTFIPEHTYIKDGKNYYFYNCDKIGEKLPDINNNDYFESIEDEVSEVKFEYKPLFVIRAFKSSGEQYTDSVDKNNNNEINDNIYNTANLIKKENGIYYADISDKSSTEYFALKAPSGSGYLEVL